MGVVSSILTELQALQAPLKLRPYGAIQMCILLLLLFTSYDDEAKLMVYNSGYHADHQRTRKRERLVDKSGEY